MAEVQFLFDNQLIAELESLIKNARHRLLLVSPFIDLDHRIKNALHEKLTKHNFELLVLYGKNEGNYYKSIKTDSLDFLMQFPNVEIRYNERLHAKFYQNDFDFIMTSLNLYDYSLANNIEVGILGSIASKGLIGKVIDSTETMVTKSVDKIGQGVFGMSKDVNPILKFQTIFETSDLMFKRKPTIVKETGIKGMVGVKKLGGSVVTFNKFSKPTSESGVSPIGGSSKIIREEKQILEKNLLSKGKTLSASQLSKTLGVSQIDIKSYMQKVGLISGDKITEAGLSKGLVMKNYLGKDYIAYPENLEELNFLKGTMT